MPAWSADGRYLAFIHHRPADQGDDLLVYDFATGQFVNAIPTNLGRNPADSAAGVFRRLEGNLSIADDPTLTRQVIIVGFVTVVCTYVPVGATWLLLVPGGAIWIRAAAAAVVVPEITAVEPQGFDGPAAQVAEPVGLPGAPP